MSGFYKNIGWSAQPRSKYELQEEMKKRIQRGQYNLNDIDTSKITDMSALSSGFMDRNLSHIDISQWDVSNVIDMEYMFYGCEEFNCYTLSNWKPKSIRARVEDVSV